jgi:predicted nucleotidyltransferase
MLALGARRLGLFGSYARSEEHDDENFLRFAKVPRI